MCVTGRNSEAIRPSPQNTVPRHSPAMDSALRAGI